MTRRASAGSKPPEYRQAPRPLSTEGSIIPGETEEDGMLRREYVLVGDTQAVEFNRAVDGKSPEINYIVNTQPLRMSEISVARRRPLQDRKMPSTPSVDDIPSPNYPVAFPTNTTFPPPPHPNAPSLSSSPSSIASRAASNALNRAISIASKKLFGTSNHKRSSKSLDYDYSTSSSPRRQQIIALDGDGERDPVEDELLAALEDLAQKTDVLTHWADEMYEYVKAVPQSQ